MADKYIRKFNPIDVSIGQQLKALREERKLSLQEVAERLGINKSTVHYWETGRSSISIPQLARLCEVYNTDYISVLRRVI